jgi:hypothetical protein
MRECDVRLGGERAQFAVNFPAFENAMATQVIAYVVSGVSAPAAMVSGVRFFDR